MSAGRDVAGWKDKTRDEFEKRFETPIDEHLAAFSEALAALDEMLNEIDKFIRSIGD
jgi:hypothetical protein